MGTDSPEKYAKLAKLIPEVSYDVICRITPGAIVIGCTLWLFQVDISVVKLELLFGLFMILLAYVVGFVIDALSASLLQKYMINYDWRVLNSHIQEMMVTALWSSIWVSVLI